MFLFLITPVTFVLIIKYIVFSVRIILFLFVGFNIHLSFFQVIFLSQGNLLFRFYFLFFG